MNPAGLQAFIKVLQLSICSQALFSSKEFGTLQLGPLLQEHFLQLLFNLQIKRQGQGKMALDRV